LFAKVYKLRLLYELNDKALWKIYYGVNL
jgi:hypothetical protein